MYWCACMFWVNVSDFIWTEPWTSPKAVPSTWWEENAVMPLHSGTPALYKRTATISIWNIVTTLQPRVPTHQVRNLRVSSQNKDGFPNPIKMVRYTYIVPVHVCWYALCMLAVCLLIGYSRSQLLTFIYFNWPHFCKSSSTQFYVINLVAGQSTFTSTTVNNTDFRTSKLINMPTNTNNNSLYNNSFKTTGTYTSLSGNI